MTITKVRREPGLESRRSRIRTLAFKLQRNKMFPPRSLVKIQYCGEHPWPRDSVLRQTESYVWKAVSSHAFHHPHEFLLVQFSLYVHKGGLNPIVDCCTTHLQNVRKHQSCARRNNTINSIPSLPQLLAENHALALFPYGLTVEIRASSCTAMQVQDIVPVPQHQCWACAPDFRSRTSSVLYLARTNYDNNCDCGLCLWCHLLKFSPGR